MKYLILDGANSPAGSGSTDAGGGGGGPTGSRTILDLGDYYNPSQNNADWTPTKILFNMAGGGAAPTSMEVLPKLSHAFTVTGWMMQQYYGNGVNAFKICKNRTGSVVPYITVSNVGSAATTGFPGNSFSGQFASGLYTFTPTDTISAVLSFASGSQTMARLQLAIEWL